MDSGPEFLPRGLDVMGLVRQLALPSAETVEKLSYGDPLFRMPTQSNIPITTDRGYVAEVLGMAPAVPPAARATTRISNEVADQLVRAIMGNPQATAPGVLEAAGQMLPIANMVKPGLSWQGKKIPDVEKLAKQSDKFLYHSDTAENIENLQYGIEPQQGGPWVREIAEGAVDDVDELLERSTPLSWFSDDPTWVKIKVSRKLGKPLSEVTVDDIREHGHLALINKKDPNLTDIYRVGEEGLGQGPYSKVKTIGGSEVKAYETPIYQDGMEPFGAERNEWIATQNVEPFVQLTGDDLVKFMRIKGLLEPEAATSSFKVVQPGDQVSGLTVREEVPNMSSISATLDDYEVLSGIREVPRGAFDKEYLDSLSFEKLDKRTKDLANQINESKEINPMIVGVDSKGAYIIEGGHRFDALMSQDTKSIPAMVVIDKSDPPAEDVLRGLLSD